MSQEGWEAVRSDEIVSYRTALRYLRRGDDPAKRRRLRAILVTDLTCNVVLGLISGLAIFVGCLLVWHVASAWRP